MNAPAENYLINEIKYLAKRVKRIYIFAVDSLREDKVTVELPRNVIAINIADNKWIRKIKIALYTLMYFLVKSETDDECGRNVKRTIKKAYFMGKSDYYYKCIYNRFVQKSKLNANDNLIVYTFWFYTYTRTAILLKKILPENVKIITRAHRYDLYSEQNSLNYIPLRIYMLENVDYVLPCSEDGSNYLKNKYPDYADKIRTAYLGSEDYGVARAGHEGQFTIVSCSRVEPVKRIKLIAEAIKRIRLQNINTDVRWIHIGDGSQLNTIKKLSEELIEDGSIKFQGAMDNAKVMEFYKTHKIDLFVNVSESEGLPISIMEAISVGIPVLATDVGGVKEIIDTGNGWLVSKDISVNELAKKIVDISKLDYKCLYEKRKASREKWEKHFNIGNNVAQLYEEITDRE